jgi:hypothetical protein
MIASLLSNGYPRGSRVPSSLAELPESMFVMTVGVHLAKAAQR